MLVCKEPRLAIFSELCYLSHIKFVIKGSISYKQAIVLVAKNCIGSLKLSNDYTCRDVSLARL